MKKQLLKIANIFIAANMIFLNTGVNANYTKAYTVRQKMTSFLEIEEHNKEEKKEEKIDYKYLSQQLCTHPNLPFPNKELTFSTPFGDAKIDIKPSSGIFIDTPRINTYDKIAEVLDEVLTKEGRKQLAGIILEYLQKDPDPNYRDKPFVAYKFDYNNFFDIIIKDKKDGLSDILKNEESVFSDIIKNEESKLYFKCKPYEENRKKLRELKEKLETCKQNAEKDLRSTKDKKDKQKDLRSAKDKKDKQKELATIKEQIKNTNKEIFKIVRNYKEKLDKAKKAATALCAILMISEPHYFRSFDGGKHERTLMRDILKSGMKYDEAFKKFIPSRKGGAKLAYEYSTNKNNKEELLKSENYSEDEEISYGPEEIPTKAEIKK